MSNQKGIINIPVIIILLLISATGAVFVVLPNKQQTSLSKPQEQISTPVAEVALQTPLPTSLSKQTSLPIIAVTPSPSPRIDLNSKSNIKLESVSPNPAINNQQITLKGQNFGSSQGHVWFYNSSGSNSGGPSISKWTDTEIVTTVTFVRGGQFYLEVETSSGQRSNKLPFTVSAGQPYVENVSPATFKKGSTITITGTEFGSSTGKVNLNSSASYGNLLGYGVIGSWADTQIIFTVPPNLESKEYALEIVTSDNRKSSVKYFNVTD